MVNALWPGKRAVIGIGPSAPAEMGNCKRKRDPKCDAEPRMRDSAQISRLTSRVAF